MVIHSHASPSPVFRPRPVSVTIANRGPGVDAGVLVEANLPDRRQVVTKTGRGRNTGEGGACEWMTITLLVEDLDMERPGNMDGWRFQGPSC